MPVNYTIQRKSLTSPVIHRRPGIYSLWIPMSGTGLHTRVPAYPLDLLPSIKQLITPPIQILHLVSEQRFISLASLLRNWLTLSKGQNTKYSLGQIQLYFLIRVSSTNNIDILTPLSVIRLC